MPEYPYLGSYRPSLRTYIPDDQDIDWNYLNQPIYQVNQSVLNEANQRISREYLLPQCNCGLCIEARNKKNNIKKIKTKWNDEKYKESKIEDEEWI